MHPRSHLVELGGRGVITCMIDSSKCINEDDYIIHVIWIHRRPTLAQVRDEPFEQLIRVAKGADAPHRARLLQLRAPQQGRVLPGQCVRVGCEKGSERWVWKV
jgi:hypothetical protein